MSCMLTGTDRYRTIQRLCTGLCAAALAVLCGCPLAPNGDTPTDNDNDNGVDTLANVEGRIVNVQTIQQVSEMEPFVSIIYTVTGVPDGATIDGYYVLDGEELAALQVVATDLPAGTSQAFQFVPANAGPGSFRLGLRITLGTEERHILSEGIVQIQGRPNPQFIQPSISPSNPIVQVGKGSEVFVSFDAGDPEGQVQWRLFYLTQTDSRNKPADQLGTQLAIGSGNVGAFSFSTAELPLGDYTLGLSATDSGDSIATTVAKGNDDLIVTIPNASAPITPIISVTTGIDVTPPTISFLAPSTTDVELFGDEAFTIRFNATADLSAGAATIEVFLDRNSTITDGFFRTLEPALPITASSVAFPDDLPEGTYFVGATVRQGSTLPVTRYAAGAVIVVRTPTLTVSAPNSSLPVAPSAAVDVLWTTNVPAIAGVVDVFARALDETLAPTGAEIELLPPSSTNVTSTQFSSDNTGVFQITVRITLNDDSSITADAPQPVIVSSLPPILWLGSLARENPTFEGAVFEGVNFEDNAGTSFSPVGDINGDGNGEFLIVARYAKPFFLNPTGVGVGEAYLVYGQSGGAKLRSVHNLNKVGGQELRGVALTGIRTRQSSSDTDGMSTASRLPDIDGDGRDELLFGFPRTASRGHNVDPRQNGVVNPRSLATLERENQFLRGGIVIVSSETSILNSAPIDNAVINLDLVGQRFESGFATPQQCVEPEPDDLLVDDDGEPSIDVHSDVDADGTGCDGDCIDPQTGGQSDGSEYFKFGFAAALARDYFSTYVYSSEVYGGVRWCELAEEFRDHECLALADPVPHEYCDIPVVCGPFSPGLHQTARDPDAVGTDERGRYVDSRGLPLFTRRSGFYPYWRVDEDTNQNVFNASLQPFGARVIGVALDDLFGTSATLSGTDIIVSAPGRTARGILLGPEPSGCTYPPACGGEINGLESSPGTAKINVNSGVAYLFRIRDLWTTSAESDQHPPRPHQYIVGEPSHCGGPTGTLEQSLELIDNIEATRIAGRRDDRISTLIGIDDFNGDGINDFAVGAPSANGGAGRVYIAFRRGAGLEGDFVLEKLSLHPANPERLTGALINTTTEDGLGTSLATGVDLNADGLSDLVIGSPDAFGGIGEVIVVFGDPTLQTPENGISVDALLTTLNANNQARAARIRGNPRDPFGRFGFNIANAGDVNGDGFNDLLIAAPGATPRFDPDPTDGVDELSSEGIDQNLNGVADDVSGPLGLPDGILDDHDTLQDAGIVYLIYGHNRLDLLKTCQDTNAVCETNDDCDPGVACTSLGFTINVDQLGTSQLEGMMVVGRRAGDRIGGGDAGEISQGGIAAKAGRGRSRGLATAGDVDGDQLDDILIGSVLADPRQDPNTGVGVQNAGEAYLIYGAVTSQVGQ